MNPDVHLPFPPIVMIETTSRCNSACVMCPWPETSRTQPQGRMDDALFDKIAQEIARHPEIEQAVPYLRNEPLLDPDLVPRVDRLKEAAPQAQVYFLSNGAALTDELTDRLLASKLDWIGFSIHAIRPETYRAVTGRKDGAAVVAKITEFVRRAQAARKHPHYVMITITRIRPHVSDEEIAELKGYFRDLGVDPIDYSDGYISRAGNIEVFGEPRIHRPRVVGCKVIWAYKIASILFNGDIVPCCMDWRREVVWGNARRESIAEIWTGANRRKFLDAIHSGKPLPPGFLCTRCEDAVPVPTEARPIAECPTCTEAGPPDERALVAELEGMLDEPPGSPAQSPASAGSPASGRATADLETRMRELRRRSAALLERQGRFVREHLTPRRD
jgi:MoaA/NifB/PqqE/SkfB family radical SAM enzyme